MGRKKEKLYLAYGSNMNQTQGGCAALCPQAVQITGRRRKRLISCDYGTDGGAEYGKASCYPLWPSVRRFVPPFGKSG